MRNAIEDDPYGIAENSITASSTDDLLDKLMKGTTTSYDDSLGGDICSNCGGQIKDDLCDGCGALLERELIIQNGDDKKCSESQLRIVGTNSKSLQPDLFRSSTTSTSTNQKKIIHEEYKRYRQRFIEMGGRAFPLDACELASEYYSQVQKQCVKKSQNKKSIMAEFFYQACLDKGCAISKSDAAKFVGSDVKGTARGNNFVRSMIADGKINNINLDRDPSKQEIATLFAHLSMEDSKYNVLKDMTYELVEVCIVNNIGTNSLPRSKVYGMAFVVFSRVDKKILAEVPSLTEICGNRTREATIKKFILDINKYHSHFVPHFNRLGLNSSGMVYKT